LTRSCARRGCARAFYTSPHLERINERIRLDGREISDVDFADTFTHLRKVIEDLAGGRETGRSPTFFECVTALAFEFVARAGAQFAVARWDGGRLDATNILVPKSP